MKYLLIILLFVTFIAPASAQKPTLPKDAISTYFSEYVDNEDFDVVYVSGKVFELFEEADLQVDDIEKEEVAALMEVVRDIQGVRILHTEINARQHWERAKQRIPTDAYELLFLVRTAEGQNVEAFVQNADAVVSELFMLINTDDSFAMLSFVGSIDLSKLSQLQKAFE